MSPSGDCTSQAWAGIPGSSPGPAPQQEGSTSPTIGDMLRPCSCTSRAEICLCTIRDI